MNKKVLLDNRSRPQEKAPTTYYWHWRNLYLLVYWNVCLENKKINKSQESITLGQKPRLQSTTSSRQMKISTNPRQEKKKLKHTTVDKSLSQTIHLYYNIFTISSGQKLKHSVSWQLFSICAYFLSPIVVNRFGRLKKQFKNLVTLYLS